MISSKTLVIFAAYSRMGIIDAFIVDYMTLLAEHADIIYVSDNKLDQSELKKIEHRILVSICEPHGEYDFGSYKRGLLYAEDHNLLSAYDNLILCNDSVFPWHFSVSGFLEEFRGSSKNWGGVFFNRALDLDHYPPHMQSYFLVFSQKIFMDPSFKAFFSAVRSWNSKQEIVLNNEVALSTLLIKLDPDFFFLFNKERDLSDKSGFIGIIEEGFPFFKKKLLRFSRMKSPLVSEVLAFLKTNTENIAVKDIESYVMNNGTAFEKMVLIVPPFFSVLLMKIKNTAGSVYKKLRR